MSYYRPVDPMTGKPIGMGSYAPSAGLQKRLSEQVQRKTSEGTFRTGPDGRMEFVPKFVEDAAAHVPTHNQQVLAHMQSVKTEPTPEMNVKRAQEEARSATAEGDDEREAMGLQESYSALGMSQAELAQAMAAPAFDPLTEPLQVGDLVECVMEGRTFTGWRGKVDSVDGTWTYVEGLGRWDADHRHCLKLIAKAGT
jgi:hypothetical protein